MSDDVEVASITIRRVLTDDDDEIQFEHSGDLSFIEGTGMLTMALDTWMRTNGLREVPE